MKKLFNSLRSRLVVIILLCGILPIILLHVIIVNTYEISLIEARKIEIRQQCSIISGEIVSSGSLSGMFSNEMSNVLNWYADAYGGRILVIDNGCRVLMDSFNADLGKTIVSDSVFKALSGTAYENYQEVSHDLEFAVPIRDTEDELKPVLGVLVLSSSNEWIHDSLNRVEEAMQIIELILMALLVLFAIYFSYLCTRPINRVYRNMQKFHSGHFETSREEFHSYTEVDRILSSADEIIDQYKKMEESQEKFVSNVSHELRTPMTSIKVLTDSLIGQRDIDEETYQEFLSDISAEIDRENSMIEDLLSMSRLSNAADSLNIKTVNINDFILELLKSLKPLAVQRNVELVYESFRKVEADIDAPKLSHAIMNLIENGIKYNHEGGYVKTGLDADHEFFFLRIEDNGVGIPEESVAHIFDRFYRVDDARSRETGGTGLGLSIAKQLVLLHDGVIKVESEENKGTTFTVRIPLKHQKKGGKQ